MPDFAALTQKKNELIRKALDGAFYLAPIGSDPITDLTGPDGQLKQLPQGYRELGWLSTDGMQFGRDVSTSDVQSFGSTTPTRSDTNADTTTVTVVAQETNLLTIEMSTGADLMNLVPKVGGGVKIAKPTRPKAKFYRGLALAVDDGDGGEIYIARELPRIKATSYAEQAFAGGDDPITWGITFTGQKDSALGYAEAYHFGGPGWNALLSAMDFKPAATA